MTIEYPQRWLREHHAVPTVLGWERPNTHELLKCQKGLDVEPEESSLDQKYTAAFNATPQFLYSADHYLLRETPEFLDFYGTDFYNRDQFTFEVSQDKKTMTVNVPNKEEFIYVAAFIQLDISEEQFNSIDATYILTGSSQGMDFSSEGENFKDGFLFAYDGKYYTVFITNENSTMTLKLTIDGNVNAIENTLTINGFISK